jgi:hypothetical protein
MDEEGERLSASCCDPALKQEGVDPIDSSRRGLDRDGGDLEEF